MGDLGVVVKLNGAVVEDRIVHARQFARLGEAPGADVVFPGADLTVFRIGSRLSIRGRSMAEGDTLHIALGSVDVELEHRFSTVAPGEFSGRFDGHFLLVVALVTVMGAWTEIAQGWMQRHWSSVDTAAFVSRVVSGPPVDWGATRHASTMLRAERHDEVVPVAYPLADGPLHLSDDKESGTGWFRWYRSAVPHDDEQLDIAIERYLREPNNTEARRLLAHSAYNADDYAESARQYRWIADRYPTDLDARIGLAKAEMRLGHHSTEVHEYRAALLIQPGNSTALAGLAVALSRLQRLDEAAWALDELGMVHPRASVSAVAFAKVAALEGRNDDAFDWLDRAVSNRGALSEDERLELRRDIAIDPALARIRKDVRLRSLVNRHLGAAGPRPIRE